MKMHRFACAECPSSEDAACESATRRRYATLAAVLLLLTSLFVLVSPHAAQAESCVTKSRHWSMQEHSGPKFGWVELHMKLCTNGKTVLQGANYTSAIAENDETGPGTLGGFQISLPQPKLYYFNGRPATSDSTGGFRTNGTYKSCNVLSGNTLCSYTANFQLIGQFRMYKKGTKLAPAGIRKPGIIAFGGRVWYVLWKAHCTNKYCQSFPRA